MVKTHWDDNETQVFLIDHRWCQTEGLKNVSIEKRIKLEIHIENETEKDCKFELQFYFPKLLVTAQYYNFSLTKESEGEEKRVNIALAVVEDTGEKHTFNIQNADVDFASTSVTSCLSFTIGFETPSVVLVIYVWVEKGELVQKLPVVWLSPGRLGFVTSPGYDGTFRTSTAYYTGEFELAVNDMQTVIASFTQFRLRVFTWDCSKRNYRAGFVQFEVVSAGIKWKKCGVQHISAKVYRSSVKLVFSNRPVKYHEHENLLGFKMMFAIMPRSQEPQQLPGDLYNCSVSSFNDFKPLLQCNHLIECAGGEDENDCNFHKECEHGMIDAGTKCYKLYRNWKEITWYGAKSECSKHKQQLVTLATAQEYIFLEKLVWTVKNFTGVFVGARPLGGLYSAYTYAVYNKFLWQWTDGRIGFSVNFLCNDYAQFLCAQFSLPFTEEPVDYVPFTRRKWRTMGFLAGYKCNLKRRFDVLCESKKPKQASTRRSRIRLSNEVDDTKWNASFVRCPSGHVTRAALSCNVDSDCGVTDVKETCSTDRTGLHFPMFLCQGSRQAFHYSQVCDHLDHCTDKSDESFCKFPLCPRSPRCRNGQCIPLNKECDDVIDCLDASDEPCTSAEKLFDKEGYFWRQDAPSVVYMDGSGEHKFVRMKNVTDDCPPTHFLCPAGDCLPVYLRCNGMFDCVGFEDEEECENYTCPGFYGCTGSRVCLHPDHLCDGLWQCPQRDDEMCDHHCPAQCQCQGLAYVCSQSFNTSSYPGLRLLDASGSKMTPSDLGDNPVLIYLNMSRCEIDSVAGLGFHNLRILDLSWNKISHIDLMSFKKVYNLLTLVLSNNPLSAITYSDISLTQKLNVTSLDLANTNLQVYNSSVFAFFPNLIHLIIYNSKLTTVTSDGFQTTPRLVSLDARGSPLTVFPTDVIKHLENLDRIYVDNYRLCCPVMLPGHFHQDNCHTQYDLLSSCQDLLKSNSYRIFLWGFAFLSIVGNTCSFSIRVFLHRCSSRSGTSGFGVFVSNLCLSDCLMGIYLTIVGASDAVYQGIYLFHDKEWKRSSTCKFAGVLSLLSSEVSAFVISLITLDRLLVIRYPFSEMHFKGRSAAIACVVMWTIGFLLATLPLLPMTSHWEFFSQTGICLPLPFVSRDNFSGYTYSFSIVIMLNFILFVFIASGQVVIYLSVRASSLDSTNKESSTREATVARRLVTVALSDFLCWFPVGLLGVLGSTGTAIPDEVNVAVAILVLPLNSALNPFLYTLNVLKEKRQKVKEQHLMKELETRMAVSQIRAWLQDHVILEEDIQLLLV